MDILTSPALPDNHNNNNSTRRRTLLLQQEEEDDDDVRSLPPARPFVYKLFIRQECLGCRNNNDTDSNNRLFRIDAPVVGRSLQDGPPTLTETTAAITND